MALFIYINMTKPHPTKDKYLDIHPISWHSHPTKQISWHSASYVMTLILSHYGTANILQKVNKLRLIPNGHNFPDMIFKCIFLIENILIYIELLLKFVPKSPIINIPALVQMMAIIWTTIG